MDTSSDTSTDLFNPPAGLAPQLTVAFTPFQPTFTTTPVSDISDATGLDQGSVTMLLIAAGVYWLWLRK